MSAHSPQKTTLMLAAATLFAGAMAVSAQTAPEPLRIDTADPAVAGAQEIFVDVPSAFYAGRQQRGALNGLRYVLLPDGTGKVMRDGGRGDVLFRLDCSGGTSCTIRSAAGVPVIVPATGAGKPAAPAAPDAAALARYLAEWVLAGVAPPAAAIEPQDDSATEPEPEAAPKAQPAETGAAQHPDAAAPKLVPAAAPSPPARAVSAPAADAATPASPAPADLAPRPAPAFAPETTEVRDQALAPELAPDPVPAPAAHPAPQANPAPETAPHSPPAPAPARKTLFQRIGLNCAITGSATLRFNDQRSGSERFGKPRASLGCGARLSEKLTLQVSVIGFADSSQKAASDAEFTYALSYRASEKVTLSYSNFSGRISDKGGAFVDSLVSGSFRASYRLPKITLPNDKTIGCSASVSMTKPSEARASLGCSYAVTKKLRIGATAQIYPSGKQSTFDPDFSYTASYRINDDWSVNYSNFANNRFFWNKSSSPGAGLLAGTVSLSYRFKF